MQPRKVRHAEWCDGKMTAPEPKEGTICEYAIIRCDGSCTKQR